MPITVAIDFSTEIPASIQKFGRTGRGQALVVGRACSGETVVVRVFPPNADDAVSAKLTKHLKQQLKSLANLHHPHLLSILRVTVKDGAVLCASQANLALHNVFIWSRSGQPDTADHIKLSEFGDVFTGDPEFCASHHSDSVHSGICRDVRALGCAAWEMVVPCLCPWIRALIATGWAGNWAGPLMSGVQACCPTSIEANLHSLPSLEMENFVLCCLHAPLTTAASLLQHKFVASMLESPSSETSARAD
eukprot:gene3256-3769_t